MGPGKSKGFLGSNVMVDFQKACDEIRTSKTRVYHIGNCGLI